MTIVLDPMDLARVRFAFSPLWECVAAFRAYHRGSGKPLRVPGGWPRTPLERNDWPLLRAVSLAPSGVIPDFLAPPPPRPMMTFAEEVDALQRTPGALVMDELAHAYAGSLPGNLREASRSVPRFIDRLCLELTVFWSRAVAPMWSRIAECLEAEVVYRSRVLAFQGTEAVFSGLHPAVTLMPRGRGAILGIRGRGTPRRRASGLGVLLVPSMFAWPDVYAVTREPWRPTIAYPARGAGELWGSAPSARDRQTDTVAMLVGRARARVLRRLGRPHTTADVARSLRLSAASVSAHLRTFREAGLLHRARVGRRVYYSLNDRGRRFLAAVD